MRRGNHESGHLGGGVKEGGVKQGVLGGSGGVFIQQVGVFRRGCLGEVFRGMFRRCFRRGYSEGVIGRSVHEGGGGGVT